jgi:hypothetical protein
VSLLGVLGSALKIGAGVVLGGPAGGLAAATSVLAGSAASRPPSQTSALPPPTPFGFPTPDSVKVTGGGIVTPLGSAGRGTVTAYYPSSTASRGHCVTKHGKPRKVRKDGKCYKRPSMNAANPRALRRAIRRIDGFKHLARAVGFHAPKALSHVSKSPITRKRSCKCR